MNSLSVTEQATFNECLNTFREYIEVHTPRALQALKTIKDGQLYREKYKSFGEFLAKEFGATSRYSVKRLIKELEADEAIEAVSASPSDWNKQAKLELAKVPPDKRKDVAQVAVANNLLQEKIVTPAAVKEAVKEVAKEVEQSIEPKSFKRADAKPVVNYMEDEYGNEIPESLWPQWKKRSDIYRLKEDILSGALSFSEIQIEIDRISTKELDEVKKILIAFKASLVSMVLDAVPSKYDNGMLLTKGQVNG
jgi:hypothetical protein